MLFGFKYAVLTPKYLPCLNFLLQDGKVERLVCSAIVDAEGRPAVAVGVWAGAGNRRAMDVPENDS